MRLHHANAAAAVHDKDEILPGIRQGYHASEADRRVLGYAFLIQSANLFRQTQFFLVRGNRRRIRGIVRDHAKQSCLQDPIHALNQGIAYGLDVITHLQWLLAFAENANLAGVIPNRDRFARLLAADDAIHPDHCLRINRGKVFRRSDRN